ncbi:hypothetical protein Pcinc_038827 [Petrolisthes cinctipes]|uniref:Uncharacterized protein n=1 Tax=Petrolisthes cinctipes TaxID=88211 RepID=A0AAE1BTK9_PETCI|nr:hypothetical protein Pcinc_038827 [Petrolisthes cinctipes]
MVETRAKNPVEVEDGGKWGGERREESGRWRWRREESGRWRREEESGRCGGGRKVGGGGGRKVGGVEDGGQWEVEEGGKWVVEVE